MWMGFKLNTQKLLIPSQYQKSFRKIHVQSLESNTMNKYPTQSFEQFRPYVVTSKTV